MSLDAHDRHDHHQFRLDEVAAAFDRVRNHRDWKAPIRAVIHASDRDIVAAAISWFTGTTAQFHVHPQQPDRLLVEAPGQRLGPRGTAEELPRRFGTRVQLTHRVTSSVDRDAVPDQSG